MGKNNTLPKNRTRTQWQFVAAGAVCQLTCVAVEGTIGLRVGKQRQDRSAGPLGEQRGTFANT